MNLIITICTCITGIAGATAVVTKVVKSVIEKILGDRINEIDKRECQSYLIDFMADIKNGAEKDEAQWQHAHVIYDYYTYVLKENSYVHDMWERIINKNGGSKHE